MLTASQLVGKEVNLASFRKDPPDAGPTSIMLTIMLRKPPPIENHSEVEGAILSSGDEAIPYVWMNNKGEWRPHVNLDEAQYVWKERKIHWAENEKSWARTQEKRVTKIAAQEAKDRLKAERNERVSRKAERMPKNEENENKENIPEARVEAKRKLDESMPDHTVLMWKKSRFLA